MRSFTYQQDSSSKFWNIELSGKSFTVTYGRIGTKGQTQTKTFKDEAAAQKEHDKLVKEKLGKGYVETTPAAKAQPTNLREALEAALVKTPDDLGNHMAYADYLQEQGDPRGEFIQVQLALEDEKKSAAERKKLQKREKELLAAHEREWLGDLAPYLLDNEGIIGYAAERYQDSDEKAAEFRFGRGWLESVHFKTLGFEPAWVLAWSPRSRLLRELGVENGDDRGELEEVLGELLPPRISETVPGAAPPAFPRSVSKLRLPPGEGLPSLWPLLRSPFLGNVRVLRVGEDQGEDWEAFHCYTCTVLVVDLVRQMPRLEELYLWAKNYDLDALFQLPLKNLRVLKVYHQNNRHRLELLAENPALGRLTHLLFHPHFPVEGGGMGEEVEPDEQEEQSYINLESVRALLRSKHLGSLTHLQLRVSSMGDAGCEEIVRSGILKRLKSLDLRHGRISDEGAEVLASCPDLRNLEYLDVERNGLTKKGIARLQKVGIATLRAKDQFSEEDAQSGQYLYEGDFE
jgi:uncharacterized protein (TIGR02996 family)